MDCHRTKLQSKQKEVKNVFLRDMLFVKMWAQNHTALVKASPPQHGLPVHPKPTTLWSTQSPSGQRATWLSSQKEPHPNQSRQSPFKSWKCKEARQYKRHLLVLAITASPSGRALFVRSVKKTKLPVLHALENQLNITEWKTLNVFLWCSVAIYLFTSGSSIFSRTIRHV